MRSGATWAGASRFHEQARQLGAKGVVRSGWTALRRVAIPDGVGELQFTASALHPTIGLGGTNCSYLEYCAHWCQIGAKFCGGLSNCLKRWCPGAESNHRHCDFQMERPVWEIKHLAHDRAV